MLSKRAAVDPEKTRYEYYSKQREVPGEPIRDSDMKEQNRGETVPKGKKLYRGLSYEEMKSILGKGFIQSDERFCVPGEGTCFGFSYDVAEDYINVGRSSPAKTGKPNFVIEIESHADVQVSSDHYPKAPGRIPVSRITKVWRFDADLHPKLVPIKDVLESR